ncbi:MAG: chloramphenicol acetyltransferase [Bacteroidales bacterium]|nr:chloramphenicol acetyltransferase [Bacteroidales bacterium]
MKTEINPQESKRAFAFELWKKAAMPKVTLFKTLKISRVIKVGKRRGMKTNMLMCWCIGQAASGIEEFYTLPVGEHLWQFDRLAVNTVVLAKDGVARLCDIPFSDDIQKFNADYLRLTKQVYDTSKDYLLGDEYMVIDTSALVECDLDGVVSVYSEMFSNPFLAWGKYRRGLFKTLLPISFQFHHAQMDGFEAARFLNALQNAIYKLKV